jgi:hypothetical protein
MGLFNKQGQVSIPARYNALSRVTNGMVIGLSGAKKKYWNGDGEHKDDGCNHFSFVDGKTVLLDTGNNVLIRDFVYDDELDFFSLQISNDSLSDPIRKYFKGTDGKYYSFASYKNEFGKWLNELLNNVDSREALHAASFDKITWFSASNGWVSEDRDKFLSRHSKTVKEHLARIKLSSIKHSFDTYELINLTDDVNLLKYFTNCGEGNTPRYPVMQLIIDYTLEGKDHQDSFDFLRTENGYKLINLGLSNTSLD